LTEKGKNTEIMMRERERERERERFMNIVL
jgi:hypothetical protein